MRLVSFDDFKLAVSDDTFEPTTISKIASKLDLDVEGKYLLDLGCGDGTLLTNLQKKQNEDHFFNMDEIFYQNCHC